MSDRYAFIYPGENLWQNPNTWSYTNDGLTTPAPVPTIEDDVYVGYIDDKSTLTLTETCGCHNLTIGKCSSRCFYCNKKVEKGYVIGPVFCGTRCSILYKLRESK